MSKKHKHQFTPPKAVRCWVLQIPHTQNTFVYEQDGATMQMEFNSELEAKMFKILSHIPNGFQPHPVFYPQPQPQK